MKKKPKLPWRFAAYAPASGGPSARDPEECRIKRHVRRCEECLRYANGPDRHKALCPWSVGVPVPAAEPEPEPTPVEPIPHEGGEI